MSYEVYRKEIERIRKSVSFGTYMETISDKIFKILPLVDTQDMDILKLHIKRIFGNEYNQFVDEIFTKYDKILTTVNKIYDYGEDISDTASRIIKYEKVSKIYLGDYSDKAQKLITKNISDGIAKNLTIKEISDSLKGTEERVTTYADALAETQFMGYSRTCKAEKASIAEVRWFEYVGVETARTREFCLEHLGKHYNIDEIKKMNNGPGQLKPVLTYCGGWRCNHEWEPDPFYNK